MRTGRQKLIRDRPGTGVPCTPLKGSAALAARNGAIVPLLRRGELPALCRLERHLCIDTTASGGNATLLAASA